jgi:Spy/CpxP family protein refolding chaperone
MADSKVRVWFALFVLVIFCVGLAGGALVARRLLPPERPIGRLMFGPRGLGPGDPDGRRGPTRGLLVERLSRELDLTAEQRGKIDQALTSSRNRLETLQRDVRDRFDAERRAVQDEIRSVLTPDQQRRFDALEKDGRGRPGRRAR